jgi:hypothetical protein
MNTVRKQAQNILLLFCYFKQGFISLAVILCINQLHLGKYTDTGMLELFPDKRDIAWYTYKVQLYFSIDFKRYSLENLHIFLCHDCMSLTKTDPLYKIWKHLVKISVDTQHLFYYIYNVYYALIVVGERRLVTSWSAT